MQLLTALAVFAYFLYALCAILDKHIVSNTSLKPVPYAFYSGFFQIFYVLTIPIVVYASPRIEFVFPSAGLTLLALVDGMIFTFALLNLYKATEEGEISRISPIIGILVPIFSLVLSVVFLRQMLTSNELLAVLFFVSGGFLISAKIDKKSFSYISGMKPAILSGFLFATYYVVMDYLFAHAGFIEVFSILQLGGCLGALLLLISAGNRKQIFKGKEGREMSVAGENKKMGRSGMLIFVADKGLSAVAAVMIFYAIKIGSATMVNSLQAVQYAFVLILTLILTKKAPGAIKEEIQKGVLLQKGMALALTAFGLILIA